MAASTPPRNHLDCERQDNRVGGTVKGWQRSWACVWKEALPDRGSAVRGRLSIQACPARRFDLQLGKRHDRARHQIFHPYPTQDRTTALSGQIRHTVSRRSLRRYWGRKISAGRLPFRPATASIQNLHIGDLYEAGVNIHKIRGGGIVGSPKENTGWHMTAKRTGQHGGTWSPF